MVGKARDHLATGKGCVGGLFVRLINLIGWARKQRVALFNPLNHEQISLVFTQCCHHGTMCQKVN